ncbi:MAG: hypothetical protein MI740_14805 [Halanaerobiales bacterium]|nr:hypothetical protein [Halanaerobiales bacterium]
MVFLLILAFIMIVLIDLRELLKTDHRIKTMLIYFFLLSVGFTISLLQIIDRAPTSPTVIIEKVVNSILGGLK